MGPSGLGWLLLLAVNGCCWGGEEGYLLRNDVLQLQVNINEEQFPWEVQRTERVEEAAARFTTEQGLDDAVIPVLAEYACDFSRSYEHVLAGPKSGFTRADLLLKLQQELGYRSYLEIGCFGDYSFSQMKTAVQDLPGGLAIGVDPMSGGTHRMTSDAFFEQYEGPKFDLVFIDGLHEAKQVLRDVGNALWALTPTGTIVLHDAIPRSRSMGQPPMALAGGKYDDATGGIWNGDVYRAVIELRQKHYLDVAVGDFDFGCAVIKVQPSTGMLSLQDIPQHFLHREVTEEEWAWFRENRVELLRILPEEELLAFALGRPWTEGEVAEV
ncbi:unnamed protein product [Chrysoparadoxa australica]